MHLNKASLKIFNQFLIWSVFLKVLVESTISSLKEKNQCVGTWVEAAENLWCCVCGCIVTDCCLPEKTRGIIGLYFIKWQNPSFSQLRLGLGLLESALSIPGCPLLRPISGPWSSLPSSPENLHSTRVCRDQRSLCLEGTQPGSSAESVRAPSRITDPDNVRRKSFKRPSFTPCFSS